MNNENEHYFGKCIENPPFTEAVKLVNEGLTEGQIGFFNDKQRILDEITPATETEKKLKSLAQFLLNQFKELQVADNWRKAERDAEKERTKEILSRNSNRCSKAWGAMVACYRAIDRHFGKTTVCTEENPVKRRKKIYNAKRHQRLKGTPEYEAKRKATRHKCRDTDKYRTKHAGYMREWRKAHKENPEKHRERNKRYRERLKN